MSELPLVRKFEGDRFVDPRLWQTRPSEEIIAAIGDLSLPENVSIGKAVVVFSEAIHLSHMTYRGDTSLSVDLRYATNALGFIADNLLANPKSSIGEKEKALLGSLVSILEQYQNYGEHIILG